MNSSRSALIIGIAIGLVGGFLISFVLLSPFWWRSGLQTIPASTRAMTATSMSSASWVEPSPFYLAIPLLVITLWISLIFVIIRALGWTGRDRSYRLEDLPAYFEEWHQRAHAHMRETAAADHPDRRG